jgi:hypothetical protein
LWLLDENLVFSDFITSDPTIKAEDWKKTQPDILIFRDWDDKYSPIYIIELKRPWRTQYSNDPIDQIFWYVERLRTNDEITVNWRPIIVLPETPIYWYFIWDITERVKSSIKRKDATAMEEWESYYWYNKSLNVYFSVFSFDFIRKNSEKRNKIFFKQLWIDV